MSAVLLIRLKITDLTAWSALESGRRLLAPGHSMTRLVRENLILFEPEQGIGADAFEGALGEAIRHSNFFVNPNKESYRFLGSSDRGEALDPPEGAWGILARARDETRDESLRQRLLREHPLRGLGAIRRGKVWWFWTSGTDGGRAVEECSQAVGQVRDQRRGLLVNPHCEASMLLTKPTPWRQIERFLIEAPPSLEEAA